MIESPAARAVPGAGTAFPADNHFTFCLVLYNGRELAHGSFNLSGGFVMRQSFMLALTAGLLLGLTPAAPAQPRPGAAELPIARVVLFSSGVGYFQRESELDGPRRIDLHFPMTDVNDLLKSLVLEDRSGGPVGTISYDNRNPLAMTLKSFALDLTANPSLGDLLNQARGEKVEIVTVPDPKGALTQAETLGGLIVGVEKQKQPTGKEVVEMAQLNLLTADGLRGLPLVQVQKVRFLRPELDQEFRKALEVLATGHDTQKKTVSLNFTGTGKRRVSVAYVTESPIWKTSYRLNLEKDKVFLQGWAVVENTTDEDWANVRLGLVSGRPISFQMDLYQPLFLTRPMVEPELFASLRPQMYNADMDAAAKTAAPPMGGFPAPGAAANGRGLAEGKKAADKEVQDRLQERRAGAMRYMRQAPAADDRINFRHGVASVATATELGEYFQYIIQEPVSLPRQKSALLPIITQDVAASKVSIYNEHVHNKFPLLGLRFKNNTATHLNQGPVTVFEDGTYAGDARIGDLRPGETRLLSYAVDLGTEVEPQAKVQETLQGAKVVKGILYATFQNRETKTYIVKNRSDAVRTVLVEHPFRSQFKLVQPEKPAERARDVYRFEVNATPGKPEKLEVVEEMPRVQTVALTNSPDESVRVFIRASSVSPKVKKALEDALALKAKVNETRRDVQKEEQALKVIEQDQARMRANMERVPQTSEAYKRYLKKFDDQETQIEKLRAEIAKLQDTAESFRKEYEDYLAKLNVE
jgi:hypothetical protein